MSKLRRAIERISDRDGNPSEAYVEDPVPIGRSIRQLKEWSPAAQRLLAIEYCLERASAWIDHECIRHGTAGQTGKNRAEVIEQLRHQLDQCDRLDVSILHDEESWNPLRNALLSAANGLSNLNCTCVVPGDRGGAGELARMCRVFAQSKVSNPDCTPDLN